MGDVPMCQDSIPARTIVHTFTHGVKQQFVMVCVILWGASTSWLVCKTLGPANSKRAPTCLKASRRFLVHFLIPNRMFQFLPTGVTQLTPLRFSFTNKLTTLLLPNFRRNGPSCTCLVDGHLEIVQLANT